MLLEGYFTYLLGLNCVPQLSCVRGSRPMSLKLTGQVEVTVSQSKITSHKLF
jgi:hypothetical protein